MSTPAAVQLLLVIAAKLTLLCNPSDRPLPPRSSSRSSLMPAVQPNDENRV